MYEVATVEVLQHALVDWATFGQKLHEAVCNVERDIESYFGEIEAIVRSRKQQLMVQLHNIHHENQHILDMQTEILQNDIKKIENGRNLQLRSCPIRPLTRDYTELSFLASDLTKVKDKISELGSVEGLENGEPYFASLYEEDTLIEKQTLSGHIGFKISDFLGKLKCGVVECPIGAAFRTDQYHSSVRVLFLPQTKLNLRQQFKFACFTMDSN
jgi:hypothetical protein